MSAKTPLPIDVYTAAVNRTVWTFDHFDHVYVAFSGGKDSTITLHIAADEARRRNRRIGLMFVDLEGQYQLTVEHIQACFDEYSDVIDPYWVALPIHLRNSVSVFDPFWMCWDPEAKKQWIRNPPPIAITDETFFPWFHRGMEFEELTPAFGHWYGGENNDAAGIIAIRSDESLNRWRTIANRRKQTVNDKQWTTVLPGTTAVNVYPIYDWSTADVWTYHARNPDKRHNEIYDLMYRAGLTPSQMRLCQPYGDDQKRGLWLFQLLEPTTWGRVVARVNGANAGAMYANTTGNVSGYRAISKPEHLTWQEFAGLLLASMPDKSRRHYENKVALHIKWWLDWGFETIPDEAPYELESIKAVPSWRRVCKALLRNDYWAKGLGFSQHKSQAYKQYMDLMERRRQQDEYGDAFQIVQQTMEVV